MFVAGEGVCSQDYGPNEGQDQYQAMLVNEGAKIARKSLDHDIVKLGCGSGFYPGSVSTYCATSLLLWQQLRSLRYSGNCVDLTMVGRK